MKLSVLNTTKRVRILFGRKSEFYVALQIEEKRHQAAHQIKGESLAITKNSDSMDVAKCQVYKAITWAVKTEKLPIY